MTQMDKFQQKPPAKVGDDLNQIESPSLVIELDAFENNLKKMKLLIEEQANKQGQSIRIRPHFKTHKCPTIAKLQKELGGAIGVCCAKLTEAESLIYGSQKKEKWDILITNSIISEPKLTRLIELMKVMNENNQPLLSICFDDIEQVQSLILKLKNSELQLQFYIEVNVGQNRCGVDEPEEVLNIIQLAKTCKNLIFKGIHAYNGANQHVRSFEERRNTVLGPLVKGKLIKCINLLKDNNIQCDIITGGGTGSFQFEIETGVYNEVQVGSYAFMDVDYGNNLSENPNEKVHDFEHSLFIYSRIQSHRSQSLISPRLIIDAGLKSLSLDSGLPLIFTEKGEQELEYISQGDEHGQIVTKDNLEFKDLNKLKIGNFLKLIPGHCDPTFNMHDYVIAIRNNKVEGVWPIEGRGPGY